MTAGSRIAARKVKMAAKQHGQLVKVSECFSGLVNLQDNLENFTESQDYVEAWRATACSSSSVITVSSWPKLSHTRHALKTHVRAGVSPAVRKKLWMAVCEVSDNDSVLFAKAFGEPADGGFCHALDGSSFAKFGHTPLFRLSATATYIQSPPLLQLVP